MFIGFIYTYYSCCQVPKQMKEALKTYEQVICRNDKGMKALCKMMKKRFYDEKIRS